MKKLDIIQYKNDSLHPIKDMVAEERILHVEINSEVTFDVIITPEDIKEFVYGNLFNEGFIKSIDEIQKYLLDSL